MAVSTCSLGAVVRFQEGAREIQVSNINAVSKETRAVAEYISTMQGRDIPADVAEKTRQHILDTIAAMVSGARLLAGQKAADFVRIHNEGSDAVVIGTNMVTTARNAALANGMSAHADETDDSHAPSLGHPGCGVVPAALAAAERKGASGDTLLKAVVAGYDIGTRVSFALQMKTLRPEKKSTFSSHALVSVFGAVAAAAVIEELNEQQTRYALSYTTQLASGVTSWLRDGRHVEKAFVFAGMPAHNGVLAAAMAAAGLDGVEDPFAGEPNFLDAWSTGPDRSFLAKDLGSYYEIMQTNIKKYCVGSPAQAAVQAVEDLLAENDLKHDEVESIEIHIPQNAAHVVDSRSMPDINVQYLVAGTLVDGNCNFVMAHDEDRLHNDPVIRKLIDSTTLVADTEMEPVRQASVTLRTSRGELYKHVPYVRGTADDPMTTDEVETKADEIMEPVVGAERSKQLIEAVRKIESVDNVRQLRELLQA